MSKHSSASRKKSASGGHPGGTARDAASPGRKPQQPLARAAASGGAALQRSRLAELRTRKPVPAANQRYRRHQRAWWQGPIPVIGTVVVVGALIVLFSYLGLHRGGAGQPTTSSGVPPQVLKDVSQVDTNVFKQVGNGGLTNPLQPITGAQPLVGANGKPQMLYVGADYCPYCAAERWSIVVALSRFGSFHNLQTTQSSSSDVYANTSTFSFYGSSYTSQYLDFSSVELTTRDPNTPLQTPTAQQKQIINTYDAPPYVSANSAGSIPFIDIGNQFYANGAGYSPQVLAGLSWQDISSKLNNPSDPVTRAIVGNANYLTNAICKVTNNQPADVCAAAPISGIGAAAPAGA